MTAAERAAQHRAEERARPLRGRALQREAPGLLHGVVDVVPLRAAQEATREASQEVLVVGDEARVEVVTERPILGR